MPVPARDAKGRFIPRTQPTGSVTAASPSGSLRFRSLSRCPTCYRFMEGEYHWGTGLKECCDLNPA
jgi:hypothetical protein